MKCSKQSFVFVSVLFAVLLSLLSLVMSTRTLNARDADLGSLTVAAAQTAKTAMHKYLPCAISHLAVLEANTNLRVSGRFPGLHPLHL